MRKHFDEQLEEMNRELTAMGELCRRAIALSCEALTSGDKVLAERVVGVDRVDVLKNFIAAAAGSA